MKRLIVFIFLISCLAANQVKANKLLFGGMAVGSAMITKKIFDYAHNDFKQSIEALKELQKHENATEQKQLMKLAGKKAARGLMLTGMGTWGIIWTGVAITGTVLS